MLLSWLTTTLAALIDDLRTDEQRQLNRIKDRIRSYFEEFPQNGRVPFFKAIKHL